MSSMELAGISEVERHYRCPHCKSQFSTQMELRNHVNDGSCVGPPVPVAKYDCPHCNRSMNFSYKFNYFLVCNGPEKSDNCRYVLVFYLLIVVYKWLNCMCIMELQPTSADVPFSLWQKKSEGGSPLKYQTKYHSCHTCVALLQTL